jgi:hypothetical protein
LVAERGWRRKEGGVWDGGLPVVVRFLGRRRTGRRGVFRVGGRRSRWCGIIAVIRRGHWRRNVLARHLARLVSMFCRF